jgi:hypothetical protein
MALTKKEMNQLNEGVNYLYDAYLKETGRKHEQGISKSLLDLLLKRELTLGLSENTDIRFNLPKGWDESDIKQNPYGINLTYRF